jgi:ABC-type multidrug transport system fused ATPase/permease subunit
MRALPVADPGTPDIRSAGRYLCWLVTELRRTVLLGMAAGIVWMVAPALAPAAIGRAIDQGITGRDPGALLRWSAVVLVLVLVQAAAGLLRHRMAVFNWLSASYRTIQLTVRQSARLGATLPKRLGTGEVVSIGTSDISHIGHSLDITARAAGALIAVGTVAVILLLTSVPLGLTVLIGAPLFTGIATLLIRPLHKRQQAYRDQQGALTTRAADIVTGLRVLRGIGGEDAFAARYAAQSQELRRAGVGVARIESYLSGAEILIPGLFVALVTWLAARFALAGAVTIGQLVAIYGYATFLSIPLRTLTEAVDKFTRGHVSARRVVRLLALEPELAAEGSASPAPGGELVDVESGLVVAPGLVTALVAAEPAEATAVCERLGRYAPGYVTLGGVALADLEPEALRRTVLVADNDARLFSGRLRDELDPRGRAGDRRLADALAAASAEDVVDGLPDGLDAAVSERGREFSGGQQQRLRLARALVADPPILVLVEPTSAVDAHTEARIAQRLGPARAGRTTLVATTSPVLLDRVDQVCYLEAGRVVAQGSHRALLASQPGYAATVTRGEA